MLLVKLDQKLCLPLNATPDFLFLPHAIKRTHWETGKAATEIHAPFLGWEGMIKRRQEPRGEDTRPGGRQIPRSQKRAPRAILITDASLPTCAGGLVS